MPIHSPSSLQQAVTQIQKSAGIKVKIKKESSSLVLTAHWNAGTHWAIKCFPCWGNADLETERRCTLKGEFLLWGVVRMLCFLSKIHTLQCLVFALLFQLKELSSLLLLSLVRQERRISVCRAPAVNLGTWEFICSAILALPWQKNGCILVWFPLLVENARSHI